MEGNLRKQISMSSKFLFRSLFFGFMTWLIPFGISFLFFKPGGELRVAEDFFKSFMIVTGALAGCYFLYRYMVRLERDFLKQGIWLGISWFFINIFLDALFLEPFMKVSFADYLLSIGLRYLVIPVISITMGLLLEKRKS
jgi:hypothetical protein